jgi:hypothetical protein
MEERVFKARASQLGKIMSNAKVKGELSVECKKYLVEWITDDFEDIDSKYFRKGNMQEDNCIQLASQVLGIGGISKNEVRMSNEWIEGTCDVDDDLTDTIIDTKCVWSYKTLQDAATKLNKDYEWQLRGYMMLYGRTNSILFYGLLDTPAEANYGIKVVWEHLPIEERWVAYSFTRDLELEEAIKEKVEQCREWIANYNGEIKKKLGIINQIK